eukprot:g34746.t1
MCLTLGADAEDLDVIYTTTNTLETKFPEALFIVASDSSQANPQAVYKQKLKWENPSRNDAQCCSKAVEDRLRDCLESVDRTMFQCSAEKPDEYVTTVTDFISKCVEDCVPKKSIRVYPNRKARMNQEIHSL